MASFSCTGGLEHGACARLPPSLFGWALRILLHGDWSVSVLFLATRGHPSASEIQGILDQTTSPATVSLLILFLRKQKTRVSFINSEVISINVYLCQPTLPSILQSGHQDLYWQRFLECFLELHLRQAKTFLILLNENLFTKQFLAENNSKDRSKKGNVCTG